MHRPARRVLLLAGTCLVGTMTTIDTTVVNIALPTIKEDFDASLSSIQWAVTSYVLVFAMLMIPAGRLADVLGRDRIWFAGAGLFALASVGCGLAPHEGVLIACRVVQGVGAAALKPATVAIVAAAFADRKGWALGIMGSTLAGAAALGPVVGGTITELLGWRAIFFVNVPIVAVAMALVLSAGSRPRAELMRREVDVAGSVLLGIAVLLLVLALNQLHAWGLAASGALLAGCGLAVAAFVAHERRSPSPVVQLRLFRERGYLAGNVVSILTSFGFFGMFLLQSLYLQGTLGFSVQEAGLLLAPLGAATLVSSTVGGRLADRVGPRVPILAGLALGAVALLLLARAGTDASYAVDVLPSYILEGIGWGLVSAPLNMAVIDTVGVERGGEATGVLSTFDKLGAVVGAVVGVALTGTLVDSQARQELPTELAREGLPPALGRSESLVDEVGTATRPGETSLPIDDVSAALNAAFMSGFRIVMLVGAAVFALALVVAYVGLRPRPNAVSERTLGSAA